ncbi:hypothetical protein HDU67_001124 [Dinochytrium kinnereticum]|nr:hypothetical protein HDU67_001124 [Dinochytrium kinnereticum]
MFKLSAVLCGHSQDVRNVCSQGIELEKARGVAAASNELLFSVSRDSKLLAWRRSGRNSFEIEKSYDGHSHFVNCVVYLQPSSEFPNGLIISGGSDKLINVFDVNDEKPLYTLIGHTDTVCCLANYGKAIVSGSWDKLQKTVRVWIDLQTKYVLKGHSQAVWSVLPFSGEKLLTGSADKTIKLWHGDTCLKTFHGHSDAVRSLAYISDFEFLSGSNDSSLRLWNIDGTCLRELSAHTSFVYSVNVLPLGGYVSGGEDRTLRVWDGQECIQTINMPCSSVWDVKALPNNDIICACSDGSIRIFTTDSNRIAEPCFIEEFDKTVAAFAIPSNTIGGIDPSKISSEEILTGPGQKNQVVMIRRNDTVEAHQFSESDGWVKVGVVVDSIGSNRKQLLNGKEYDYVFEIDIGAGINLKLPYNASDNPYAAAQQFIYDNELPQDYLDKIASFIMQNSQGISLSDERKYQSNPDPFTGGSSGVTSKPILPQREYSSFKVINVNALRSKLIEFNDKVTELKLTSAEISSLDYILASPSSSIDPKFVLVCMDAVLKIAFKWPETVRFPGLDLLRYTLAVGSGHIESLLDIILLLASTISSCDESTSCTNAMLSLKCLTNTCSSDRGRVLEAVRRVLKRGILEKKQVSLSVSTLLANLSILLTEKGDEGGKVDLLEFLNEILPLLPDEESEYRCWVAVGTLRKRPIRILVHDANIDIDGYTSGYIGFSKIKRLEFIAEVCPPLQLDALKLALDETKVRTKSVFKYSSIIQAINAVLSTSHLPLMDMDTEWMESTSRYIRSQQDKLEMELKNYKNNLIKESIRMGHQDLGDLYFESGDFQNSLKCYSRTRDYCTTSKHMVDMCLNVIKVSFSMMNLAHIHSYAVKAESTIDSPERNLITGRLRCYVALASLDAGKYRTAAQYLLDVPFETSSTLPDILSQNDVAIYGALCALASFDRDELKKKVFDNVDFKSFLELEPRVREVLTSFYNSNYRICLKIISAMRVAII